MATLTPKQTRDAKLAQLLATYQDGLSKMSYYKDRADSMAAVIATAPFSYTIVDWRGEVMTKSQLQGYQSDNASKYSFWQSQTATFKNDYDDYLAYCKEQDNLDFISANPALAPQLAQIAAEQQTNTSVGIATAVANAQASEEANTLQAKSAIAEAEAKTKRNNIIIIVVVVVVAIGVGLFLWKKFGKKLA